VFAATREPGAMLAATCQSCTVFAAARESGALLATACQACTVFAAAREPGALLATACQARSLNRSDRQGAHVIRVRNGRFYQRSRNAPVSSNCTIYIHTLAKYQSARRRGINAMTEYCYGTMRSIYCFNLTGQN
jgi:hypothetical protein